MKRKRKHGPLFRYDSADPLSLRYCLKCQLPECDENADGCRYNQARKEQRKLIGLTKRSGRGGNGKVQIAGYRTAVQVSAILGIADSTIGKWIKLGLIPEHKLKRGPHNAWLIPVGMLMDIKRLVEDRQK